jgi:hypothetical protein
MSDRCNFDNKHLTYACTKIQWKQCCVIAICYIITAVYKLRTIGSFVVQYKGKKVKQSLYRPGQALRFQEIWGSQILRQWAHESSKVVSPTHRPSLNTENIPGTHFCWVSIVLLINVHYISWYKTKYTTKYRAACNICDIYKTMCPNIYNYLSIFPSVQLFVADMTLGNT